MQTEAVESLGPVGRRRKDFQLVLSEAVTLGLTSVLGSSGARAAFFHLGLTDSSNAKKVHDGLARYFGAGTQSLEASILRELYSRVGMPFAPEESMTFSSFVVEAKKFYTSQTEEAT